MKILDMVNWIASFLSIISAIVSFLVLKKSKSIRNEILKKRNIEKYSEFVAKSNFIVEKIKKFTKKNRVQGSNIENYIECLKNYYELIKTIEYNIANSGHNSIHDDIKILEKDIQFYSKKGNDTFANYSKELNDTYFNIIKIQNDIKMNIDKIVL